MLKFEKVSLAQWRKDAAKLKFHTSWDNLTEEEQSFVDNAYNSIKLPTRATAKSAGYDFFLPYDVSFTGGYQTIPTGIRFIADDPKVVLQLYPRSGLGFKYGSYLANTVGIIDADYADSDNEGHIMLKMNAETPLVLEAGKGIMQGILQYYLIIDDDEAFASRNGGFGSTGA